MIYPFPQEYRRKVVEEIKSKGIDAIVGPAMPIPAMKAGTTQEATGQFQI